MVHKISEDQRERYCFRCGNRLVKGKGLYYDFVTGEQIYDRVCPKARWWNFHVGGGLYGED